MRTDWKETSTLSCNAPPPSHVQASGEQAVHIGSVDVLDALKREHFDVQFSWVLGASQACCNLTSSLLLLMPITCTQGQTRSQTCAPGSGRTALGSCPARTFWSSPEQEPLRRS